MGRGGRSGELKSAVCLRPENGPGKGVPDSTPSAELLARLPLTPPLLQIHPPLSPPPIYTRMPLLLPRFLVGAHVPPPPDRPCPPDLHPHAGSQVSDVFVVTILRAEWERRIGVNAHAA